MTNTHTSINMHTLNKVVLDGKCTNISFFPPICNLVSNLSPIYLFNVYICVCSDWLALMDTERALLSSSQKTQFLLFTFFTILSLLPSDFHSQFLRSVQMFPPHPHSILRWSTPARLRHSPLICYLNSSSREVMNISDLHRASWLAAS